MQEMGKQSRHEEDTNLTILRNLKGGPAEASFKARKRQRNEIGIDRHGIIN